MSLNIVEMNLNYAWVSEMLKEYYINEVWMRFKWV